MIKRTVLSLCLLTGVLASLLGLGVGLVLVPPQVITERIEIPVEVVKEVEVIKEVEVLIEVPVYQKCPNTTVEVEIIKEVPVFVENRTQIATLEAEVRVVGQLLETLGSAQAYYSEAIDLFIAAWDAETLAEAQRLVDEALARTEDGDYWTDLYFELWDEYARRFP